MERERRTLAAEVHDGLAQYLARRRRELALPEPGSRERLQRGASTPPTGSSARGCRSCSDRDARGLRDAIEDAAARARRAAAGARERRTATPGPEPSRSPRASSREALANADAHARRDRRRGPLRRRRRAPRADRRRRRPRLRSAAAPGVEDGHLGLTVMRQRARGYGGDCESSRARRRDAVSCGFR